MTVAELKERLEKVPDSAEVILSFGTGNLAQLVGNTTMFLIPKDGGLYLKQENAEKSGEIWQKVLVLWGFLFEDALKCETAMAKRGNCEDVLDFYAAVVNL